VEHLFQIQEGSRQLLVYGIPAADTLSIATFLLLIPTILISMRALRESARSNALSSLPIIVLKYSRGRIRGQPDKIYVENIGNGAALDIKVDNYYTAFVDNVFFADNPQYANIKFGKTDILRPSEEKPLDTSKSKIDQGFVDLQTVVHQLFHNQKNLIFNLRYSDVSGTRYISKIRISPSQVHIVGSPKKYSALYKIRYGLHLIREFFIVKYGHMRAHFDQRKVNKENSKKIENKTAKK
jgi:hypothetical protein